MAVQQVILKTDPARPLSYNDKAVRKALDESYLIGDVKKDGVRLNLVVRPIQCEAKGFWEVLWLSREGKEFPALSEGNTLLNCDERWIRFFNPHLGAGLYPDGFMLDAELVVSGDAGFPLPAKDTAGALRRNRGNLKARDLNVHVFGVVPLGAIESGEDYGVTNAVMKYHAEYQTACLKEAFPEIQWAMVESLDLFTMEEVEEFYSKVRAQGEEGIVLKDPQEDWLRGKRKGQWKMVPDDNADGVVVGLVWGTPGLANEGKVIGFEVLTEHGITVNACKISQALMDKYTATVKGLGEGYFNGHAVRITFMERFPDGSYRHPSFDCFRGISDPKIKE